MGAQSPEAAELHGAQQQINEQVSKQVKLTFFFQENRKQHWAHTTTHLDKGSHEPSGQVVVRNGRGQVHVSGQHGGSAQRWRQARSSWGKSRWRFAEVWQGKVSSRHGRGSCRHVNNKPHSKSLKSKFRHTHTHTPTHPPKTTNPHTAQRKQTIANVQSESNAVNHAGFPVSQCFQIAMLQRCLFN